jgi:hypothetical protein
MSNKNELVAYLEGLLTAVRAGELTAFAASAVVLPAGSNELDGRAFAALDESAARLSSDDLKYVLNVATVGMSNAFEQLAVQASATVRAAEAREKAEADTRRIVL